MVWNESLVCRARKTLSKVNEDRFFGGDFLERCQFHMDSHSSELRYECSYCHKRFRGFKTCRVHELRHKEANQPGKFSCQICSKRFMTRQTLKVHPVNFIDREMRM